MTDTNQTDLKMMLDRIDWQWQQLEWEPGDIDWSGLELFLNSLTSVAASSPDPHRNVLNAAIQRLHVVAREIQRLDPRLVPEIKWGDAVIYHGEECRLRKPIGQDEVQLHSAHPDHVWAEGELIAPWKDIRRHQGEPAAAEGQSE